MTHQEGLRYESIEAQIVEWLPELRPAAERYWEEEGPPGQDCGPYIFIGQVLEPYVEVLLAMGESRMRNHLLGRAFALLDAMLDEQGDYNVRGLAFIEFLQNADAWWLGRARSFLGSKALAELRSSDPDWLREIDVSEAADLEREIIDLWGVRDVVMAGFGDDVRDPDVPGISAPREWQALPSLEVAREVEGAAVFVSCFGTSRPYVVAPARQVLCDADTLRRLAVDLATRDGEEPDQQSKASVHFFRIRIGERVWQMNEVKGGPHTRWEGVPWIAKRVKELGLEPGVREVLAGSRLRATERE
jgi:hypothetical protein